MLEAKGNLWEIEGDARCVLTNCVVNNGRLVMGGGVALEARTRYPELDSLWGGMVRKVKNHVFFTWNEPDHAPGTLDLLIAFPTKEHYRNPSVPGMILESGVELMQLADKLELERILLPRPGCGLGGLEWSHVKSIISPILDDRVTVVTF